MSNEAKMLRKQLRNVVAEILPELLTEEMKKAMYLKLADDVNKRVDNIAKVVKETLDKIDDRSKSVQDLVIRQTTVVAPVETKKD